MEKLQWFFEIIDQATGPAGKIVKALDGVDKAAKGSSSKGPSGLFQAILGGMTSLLGPKAVGGVMSALYKLNSGSVFATFVAGIGNAFGPAAAEKAIGFAGAVAKIGPVIQKLGPAAAAGASFVGKAFLGIAAIGATVGLAVGTAVASLAVSGGRWAIDALMFKEDTIVGFKTMLGSQEAAEEVYKQAAKFAATTAFSEQTIVSAFQRFTVAGFKTSELENLMKAAGDVGSAFGTDKMDSFISALSKIKAKGKLGGEELMALAEAGISQQKVFEALAKTTGHSMEQVQKDISGGKIKAEAGIAAIMDAVAKGLSGGKIGSLMEAKGNTLSGLFTTLFDRPKGLLNASSALTALDPLKKFISSMITALDPDSPTGKRIVVMFDAIAASVGAAFSKMGEIDLDKTFGKALDVVEPLVQMMLSFGDGFMRGLGGLGPFMDTIGKKSPEEMAKFSEAAINLGLAAGAVASAFLQIVLTIGQAIGPISAAFFAVYDALMLPFDGLPDEFHDLGVGLMKAFIRGMIEQIPMLGVIVSAMDILSLNDGGGAPQGRTVAGIPVGPSGGVGMAPGGMGGGSGGPVDQSKNLTATVAPGAVVQNFYGQENPGATAAQGLQGQLVGMFGNLAAQAGG